jgi:hypothetical protein
MNIVKLDSETKVISMFPTPDHGDFSKQQKNVALLPKGRLLSSSFPEQVFKVHFFFKVYKTVNFCRSVS